MAGRDREPALPGWHEYPPAEVLTRARLVSLTHTPSPMGFLNEILEQPPDTERPFLLMVVGYPAEHARVPDITRKDVEQVTLWR